MIRLSSLVPHSIRDKIRDRFYRIVPIKGLVMDLMGAVMPTFLPIAGYLKCNIPGKGDRVVDAGAFPGNFTIILSRLVGRDGLVIAIEPDEKKCTYLSKRFDRLGYDNIMLLQVALWNRDGVHGFCTTGDEGSSFFASGKEAEEKRVKTRTLDRIARDLGLDELKLIKMDIEGAEIEAIEGAKEVLEELCPNLVIAAYHLRHGEPTYKRLAQRLSASGYNVRVGFSRHLTLYATKSKNPG